MKQENKFVYGDQVVEFFPFDQNELQDYTQRAEDTYYNAVKSLIETDKLAASIQFHKGPLSVALGELISLVQAGYTIREDRYIGMQGGALDVTLAIPQDQIELDLVRVHAQAFDDAEASRFERNRVETEYQVSVTLARAQRDEEKRLAAAAERAAAKAREQALADLKAAYAS
ncbi:hypothetical protein ACSEPQ_07115 [Pseudomonas aeruginosa]